MRALEERLHREDPRFAEALAHGRPCRPREYRHGRAWLLTGFGLVLLGIGIAVGDGLLIATGLVTAGLGGHLFDPPHGPRAPRR
ncbi:DUF3040 domain-containing protein [Streptomyces sp. NPDC005805]|uniref:DUF3040 domain-containing protein n=1 Tax=Streptomyces sp. NPDC005805 TaxID=3157068 RepID=UPI0033D2BA24